MDTSRGDNNDSASFDGRRRLLENERKPKNEDDANWFSKFTFFWINSLINAAAKGQLLEMDDLPNLTKEIEVGKVDNEFMEMLHKYPSSSGGVPLLRALHQYLKFKFYPLCLPKVFYDALSYMSPLLVGYMVELVSDPKASIVDGVYISVGLVVSNILMALTGAHYAHLLNRVCMKVDTVGLASTVSLGIALFVLVPVYFIAKKMASLYAQLVSAKDRRVMLVNEAIHGMQTLKLNVLEDIYEKRILKLRREEVKYLKRRKYIDALSVYIWATTSLLMATFTFVVFVLLGNRLTPSKVFTSLSLCQLMFTPVINLPWFINSFYQASVSIKRIACFLSTEAASLDFYCEKPTSEGKEKFFFRTVADQNIALDMNKVAASWEEANATIKDITFSVKQGELVGIYGPVGSGKSSLLYAILGEISKCAGSVYVRDWKDGVAFVSQDPWLSNSSVRDNIVFEKEFNSHLYSTVIDACALGPDLLVRLFMFFLFLRYRLPQGDQTLVGERGRALSGGQRARVALARAVYQDKPLYLLDDPFSAVDRNVANVIFDACILGCLRSKTVLMVTHKLDFLRRVDKIIFMKKSGTVIFGSPDRMLPLISAETSMSALRHDGNDEAVDFQFSNVQKMDYLCYKSVVEREDEEEKEDMEVSFTPCCHHQIGLVKFSVYKSYIRSLGCCMFVAILFAFILMQTSRNASDWYLSYWLQSSKGNETVNRFFAASGDPRDNISTELIIYASLAVANSVFVLFRAFLYAYGCLRAARVLHDRLLHKILQAPLRFFNETAPGRIINRISSDIFTIDDALPSQANILAKFAFEILGAIVVLSYSMPWCLVSLLPLFLYYGYIHKAYRLACCSIKRLYSVSLSPVYSHFVDSIGGAATIRALRVSNRCSNKCRMESNNVGSLKLFVNEFLERFSFNMRSQYSEYASTIWLSIRIQIISIITLGTVCATGLLQRMFGQARPELVGLGLSYVLLLKGLLAAFVPSFTESEKAFVSVERVLSYINNLESESSEELTQETVECWPAYGGIVFENVVVRYTADGSAALDNISFEIHPGEHIGIVGRTGAGKSTIFGALFRVCHLEKGRILIDGLDIASVGIRQLRSKLGIVSQDPFLFSGTIRENLDMKGEYTKEQLLQTIESSELGDLIEQLGGLDHHVEEGGTNLSAGQRQLICLVRAIMTKKKIVCIDEATSHVDLDTDARMQRLLRKTFADATVLTIAHRVNTVLSCDRTFVVEGGRIVECGTPEDLIHNPESKFRSLIGDTSILG
ncbi:multidrug resistance associated protein 7 [Trichuris trichiura]|uniref:Multidrug resistance associated protein 7 n=1 Tax=Trichuris trichiura TaxID=36087 RepID=A0A077ZAZ4_TRITR|nr:multidrug resistance associated protein 7 [Trichuris trichiura]